VRFEVAAMTTSFPPDAGVDDDEHRCVDKESHSECQLIDEWVKAT
jgi:hypothetical protein